MDSSAARPAIAKRLEQARVARGFDTAKAAATFFGWNYNTYSQHERGERIPRRDTMAQYARAFRVSLGWLLTGEGRNAQVKVVGRVLAGDDGSYIYGTGDDPDEYVEAPDTANDNTVAVEVRGQSLGRAFDGWLLFYDDVHSPVTEDLIGHLCVVGLADERTLVKIVQRSRTPGLYHLYSNATEDPILDAPVLWAARVRDLRPR